MHVQSQPLIIIIRLLLSQLLSENLHEVLHVQKDRKNLLFLLGLGVYVSQDSDVREVYPELA